MVSNWLTETEGSLELLCRQRQYPQVLLYPVTAGNTASPCTKGSDATRTWPNKQKGAASEVSSACQVEAPLAMTPGNDNIVDDWTSKVRNLMLIHKLYYFYNYCEKKHAPYK